MAPRAVRSRALALAFVGAALWLGAACSSRERYPPLQHHGGFGTGGDDGLDAGSSYDGPPPLDAAGLCGNQIHEAIADAPNIYFVLDNSGSMAEPVSGGGDRYDAVRSAAIDVVRKLGPLINVGAALFPRGVTDQNQCHEGGQVLKVIPGTPPNDNGKDSKTTLLFANATKSDPNGGTPTSSTLKKLAPVLAALAGKTIVVLATDGAPNCNGSASCTAEDCMANIEGACDPNINCCAPNGPYGPTQCVDRPATVDAITDIAAGGIDVYVVGIPGSEVYAGVLDEMAVAGGAPHPGSPSYYKVDDVAALGDTFGEIASIVVSCTFTLTDPPPEPGMTNVYLDKQILPEDPVNGWTWTDDKTIELHGDACARLKGGKVGQVQIVSGCPTEQPK